jgi:RHS repeat-associated protein
MQWEFAAPLPHTNAPPSRTMAYNDDNELKTVDGVNVTVDLDGNLTYGPLTNDNFAAYTFDSRNRLLNAGGVTNAYDGMNNRIGQTCGTNSIIYVVNPNAKLPQVLERIKNGVTTYYIYGAGLLYQITETATATNTVTYHYDYRGSTIALSGDNGLVTDRMEYSLYGTLTYRVGANDTPFLFNGRYGVMTDPNGLLYMRARYYNPYLCRFVGADPSAFSGGLNFYAYANGNPVSYLDPFGLGAVGEPPATTVISSSSINQNMVTTIMCHGESAGGYNGNPNAFAGVTTIPGSGPNAMQGYSTVETISAYAAPILASQAAGPLGDALDAVVIADVGAGAAAGTGTAVMLGNANLSVGPALVVVTPEGEVVTTPNLMLSHQVFAQQVLGTTGTQLPAGAWVGTVGNINGQIVGINSFTFFGNQAPASAAIQTILRAAVH